jgi:hypothetical protein
MIELELNRGGTALVLETDGERVLLLAAAAAPPGSTLHARFGDSSVSIKVRGSRRVEPDAAGRSFRVEGRFQSLPRHVRLRLAPEPTPTPDVTQVSEASAASDTKPAGER